MSKELTKYIDHCGETVYSLAEIEKEYTHKEIICENCILFLKQSFNDYFIDFIMVQFSTDNFIVGIGPLYRKIFEGCGASNLYNQTDQLRELRHMWFGEENGYVFSMPVNALIESMRYLSKYFDF